MKELLVATTNRHKYAEIAELLQRTSLRVSSLQNYPGFPRVVEDGSTFEENAVKKALEVSLWAGKMVLADDSGLAVEELDGSPGVYSARFSGKNATDKRNINKLLKLLKNVPEPRRKAAFVCSIALAEEGTLLKVFTGDCRGRIALAECGSSGFGYDPVFIPLGYRRSFAQMSTREKNALSHRGKALTKAGRFLKHIR